MIRAHFNAVLCPQCAETSLFNTNWTITAFWSFGIRNNDRWRLLMKGDPSCGFSRTVNQMAPPDERRSDAIVEAVAYTNENFPDINDDPPFL